MDRAEANAILHEAEALIAVEPAVFDATLALVLDRQLPHLMTRLDDRLGTVLVNPRGGRLDADGDMIPFTTLYRAA